MYLQRLVCVCVCVNYTVTEAQQSTSCLIHAAHAHVALSSTTVNR